MHDHPPTSPRTLALALRSRGFGFAVLRGRLQLIDWGTKNTKDRLPRKMLTSLETLLNWYQPQLVVLEDTSAPGSRRLPRIRKMIETMRRMAEARNTAALFVSRSEVRAAFAPWRASNKHQIAEVVAERFPELAPHLPPKRECYMGEDERMTIFDAVAFALTVLESNRTQRKVA